MSSPRQIEKKAQGWVIAPLCDKTRDLKQGMMQELLTGRIRLNVRAGYGEEIVATLSQQLTLEHAAGSHP